MIIDTNFIKAFVNFKISIEDQIICFPSADALIFFKNHGNWGFNKPCEDASNSCLKDKLCSSFIVKFEFRLIRNVGSKLFHDSWNYDIGRWNNGGDNIGSWSKFSKGLFVKSEFTSLPCIQTFIFIHFLLGRFYFDRAIYLVSWIIWELVHPSVMSNVLFCERNLIFLCFFSRIFHY